VPVGLLSGLEQAVGYLTWDAVRRRVDSRLAAFVFAAVMTTIEWAQYHYTPLASWGTAAFTQLGNLALLQMASVFGMASVSFLVYCGGGLAEIALTSASDDLVEPRARAAASLVVFAAVVAAVVGLGTIRLNVPFPRDTVTMAAIGTTGTFTGPDNVPDRRGRAAIIQTLLDDTARAADGGARVAVWTEVAAIVMPDEQAALMTDIRRTAKQRHVHVVAAYLVMRSAAPLLLENKYVWAGPDGAVLQTYVKHHPVPGEPILVGHDPQTAIDSAFGRLSGALCYDYDYPAIAAEHGRLGADIVALPSSDWRGIDPIHTEMATMRAIEQGVSIVRSTRFGLSAGIDPHGVMRARRSSFETQGRILFIDLPQRGTPTVYRRIGDVFVAACVTLVGACLIFIVGRNLGSSSDRAVIC
jgi:apolipoprotein N-acyltransferase